MHNVHKCQASTIPNGIAATSYAQCTQTSKSKGYVSVDRSDETALLGTTPRPRAKSSANDFAPWPILELISSVLRSHRWRAYGNYVIAPVLWLSHLSSSLSARAAYLCRTRRQGTTNIVANLDWILT